MTTIAEWIKLTDNRLKAEDVCLEAKFIGRLRADEYSDWILREDDASDYQDWYPIQVDAPGHMFRAYYINLNRTAAKHGLIYCLAVFMSGDHEFLPSGRSWREDDPNTPAGGVKHTCGEAKTPADEKKQEEKKSAIPDSANFVVKVYRTILDKNDKIDIQEEEVIGSFATKDELSKTLSELCKSVREEPPIPLAAGTWLHKRIRVFERDADTREFNYNAALSDQALLSLSA
jgi:hypothetical protein